MTHTFFALTVLRLAVRDAAARPMAQHDSSRPGTKRQGAESRQSWLCISRLLAPALLRYLSWALPTVHVSHTTQTEDRSPTWLPLLRIGCNQHLPKKADAETFQLRAHLHLRSIDLHGPENARAPGRWRLSVIRNTRGGGSKTRN